MLGYVVADSQNQTTVISPEQLLQASKKYGPLAVKRFEAWQALVDNNLNKSERIKLEKVNDFFNQVLWVSDQQHWGTSDYWATPIEMLGTDAGDCEDYTIAKYFTLKALGVPESKLYLTYVKAIRLNQAHMVLTYFEKPNTIPLVLDNINKRILPASKRQDLVPIYSFNGDGLWLAKERGKGKAVAGGSTRLKKWNSLLKKMDMN
ncbi:MAG: transglutaminase-like cysteine peptidase [Thiotrichales bacterium]|nr:transglutaminase-like cysteine peptidase [Thiotrichales bacterium]